MKKKTIFILIIAIFGIAAITTFLLRTKKQIPPPIKIDSGFSNYISGYTGGIVSVKSNIRIKLASPVDFQIESGAEIDDKFFDFDPELKGKSYWIDDRTIEFRPEQLLPYGTLYESAFWIEKIKDTPEEYSKFEFQFQTSHQQFSIKNTILKPYSNKNLSDNQFKLTISSSDYIEIETLERITIAEYKGKSKELKWKHDNIKRLHTIIAENITREEKDGKLKLLIKGNEIGIEDTEEIIEIPSINSFRLMQMVVIQQPDQHILLRFSDPIYKSQDLRGLIRIKGEKDLSFSINGSEIIAYTPSRFTGTKEVIVEAGIMNTNSYKTPKKIEQELTFEAIKPQVRLIGNGVIMPNSDGLKFPFEAVNLSAIDVKIVKIFEDNIAQFLQVNQLDGDYQLKRVGRLILKKKIELISQNVIDYGQWNAFSIELSDLIKADPGAIYKVELSFKKQYSLYPCAESHEDTEDEIEQWDDSDEKEQTYWDSAEDYYDYDYYYYSRRERENPCHIAYYRNKKVSRNVLASDLGIIAKSGTNKKLQIAVNDLNSTKPLNGVQVEVYNYQQQLINSKKTDNEGLVSISFDQKPFLLIAKKGNQRGYLKLNDGSSLSLSKFDVSGKVVQKGIKGYIYGERGVWRPGDSLFVSFILEDEEKTLPEHHPVIFELYDPNVQIVKRLVSTNGINGFYTFEIATDADAQTGTWSAKIRVGGVEFNKSLRIEAVKPNRLKINIDFGTEKLTAKSSNVAGNLNVKWLHGAIAKNLKAQVDVKLSEIKTKFDRFKDYIFDDPASSFETEEFTIFDERIDSDGNAKIHAKFDIGNNTSGMLKATFLTRVFEEGGEFSIDKFSIPYAPFNYYVGLKTPKGDKLRGMLLTDEKQKVEVVTVDANGKPVSRKNLKVNIYKVHWRWWWASGTDNLASYIGTSRYTPVFTENVSTDKNGIGDFSFEIKYPEWGRYLIRINDNSGHICGKTVYVDWPGWAGRGQRENPGGASMLMFSAEKKKYNVGESAKISFPSSKDGRALVSLENGTRVINTFWVETNDKETSFEFKLTEEMTPNIYVNITLVQPHNQTINDLPIRLYGVIPLFVEDLETRLTPVIEMPKELRSEQKFKIDVNEQNGKAMTYTLAIVDEGLLDLTRFKTPDPWNTFYAREALGVKTWDMFDMVLGAYGGKIQQVFAIGGDEDIINKDKKKANRFKPVVTFLGPFELKRNKTNTHNIQLPKYIGAVRTMIVAGNEGAYGFDNKSTQVKNPLMLLATMPRVAGPNEQIKLPVTLFAMDEKIKKVNISVETNEFFEIIGNHEKTINITEIGESDLSFDLQVAKNLGIGKVKIVAISGNEKAEYEIEMDIRASNPPITETYSSIIKAGESWETDAKVFGIEGTNSATLEISNMPPIDFGRRLKYLLRYPHGCIEQTTSAAFPQLYLSSVLEVDDEMKNMIEINIHAALERILSFQIPQGGYSYWPGGNKASGWGTSYAGHFILEAEKKGYTLPIGLKENWLSYQKRIARNWSFDNKNWSWLDQAYRLYTLALAGKAEIGAMNRLREQTHLSKQAKWRLAAAYTLAGKENIANSMLETLSWEIEDYRELSYTYGSTIRDYAMILETYSLLKKQNEAIPLMEKISSKLSSQQWLSTQETAYCLMAMAKFADDAELTDKNLEFSFSFFSEKDEIRTDKSIKQFQKKISGVESFKSKVENKGNSILYVNLSVEGTPLENTLAPENNNLSMKIEYRTIDGKNIDIGSITQGTDFKAIVTLKNPGTFGNYREMAITQIFPSGWEIHNTRMFDVGSTQEIDKPDYQDIRDDRIYTYFDLKSSGVKSFVVLLNAAYVGKYYLPTVYCEAMYDNRINSRTTGQWVKVVK